MEYITRSIFVIILIVSSLADLLSIESVTARSLGASKNSAGSRVYLPAITQPPPLSPEQLIEAAIARLINEKRQANGLAPLNPSITLSASARTHGVDMARNGFFGHDGSDGSRPFRRAVAAGYNPLWVGENIAGGNYGTPERVVQAWIDSPSHLSNILGKSYVDLGVGYVYSANSVYGHYFVTEFGKPKQ